MTYKEPPEHLWLVIDLSSIRFDTKQDKKYVEEIVIRYNPELFTTINSMYKAYMNDLASCLDIKTNKSSQPKIMKKVKKK